MPRKSKKQQDLEANLNRPDLSTRTRQRLERQLWALQDRRSQNRRGQYQRNKARTEPLQAAPAPEPAPATPAPAPAPPPKTPTPCSIEGCPEKDAHSQHNGKIVCSRHLACLINGTTARTLQNATATPSGPMPEMTDPELMALKTAYLARRSGPGDIDPNAPDWYRNAGLHKAGGETPFRLPDRATVQQMARSRPVQCEGHQTVAAVPGENGLNPGSRFTLEDGHRQESTPAAREEQIQAYRELLANATLSDADLHEMTTLPVVSRVWNLAKAAVAAAKEEEAL